MDLGIIGGADGPTAVFIATGSVRELILFLALLAAVIAGVIYWIRRKRKK